MGQRSNDSTLVYSSVDSVRGRDRRADTPRNARQARSPSPTGIGRERSAESMAQAAKLDGIVRVWLERKGRNGKPVSIVRGLALDAPALGALASRLKRVCGTGGSAKGGEIIIQGDHRTRIASELERDGHRVKLAGG